MKDFKISRLFAVVSRRFEAEKFTFPFLLLNIYCLIFIISFTGCSSSIQQVKHDELKEKLSIEKISVAGGGSEVLIEASGPIAYTAFKLSEPSRLVLDIPGADIEKVNVPIDVNNEFINRIVVANYGEHSTMSIARVEIGLNEKVVSDVKMSEGNIVVALNHETLQQSDVEAVAEEPKSVDKTSETQPLTETIQQEIAKKEEPITVIADVSKTAITEPEKVDVKKADKLLKIETSKYNDRTIIKIIGNGHIGDFNAFTMDKPEMSRIVVDVWNVKSSISKDSFVIKSPFIKKIRIGEHPDKVRLVFDSGQNSVPPYAIERTGNSIVLTAGKIEAKQPEIAVDAIASVISEPETVKSVDYAEIYGVDFNQSKGNARLIVTSSKKSSYRLLKMQDERALVFDIINAVIPAKLERTLDASELNTPVESISSYQSSINPAKDVRIFVKLKEKVNYTISQDGDKIQVDFPPLATAQAVPKMAEMKSSENDSNYVKATDASNTEVKTNKNDEHELLYAGRRISLDFKDGDINNILRLMAEVSNLNIIAGEDVKGKVSLRLVDVPWDQAFDIILKTNGLGKVQEGNVIRVMPQSKVKQESDDVLASRKAKEKLEDLEIKLISVNYAKASEMEAQVKGLLSDRGSVTVESRTNRLIIKDIPSNIQKAVDLVSNLDTQTPQVLIEARIVEAQSNFARDLGVQWGAATGTTSKDKFTTAFGSSSTAPSPTLLPTGFVGSGGSFSEQPNYAVSLPASGAAGALGAMGFSFGKLLGDPFLLDLRISAGEKKGLTKTISRPRITTMDNKEAKISQGDSVPFETTSSSGTQTQFIDATLELTVTPHITPDGSVSMKIKASRNSIGSFRSAAGTPSISKKEASTEIIVKSGETAVIGGIVVEDKSDTNSGIPWFKDIPILGWFFKNKSTADSQTELLIFITPNIVKGQVVL